MEKYLSPQLGHIDEEVRRLRYHLRDLVELTISPHSPKASGKNTREKEGNRNNEK